MKEIREQKCDPMVGWMETGRKAKSWKKSWGKSRTKRSFRSKSKKSCKTKWEKKCSGSKTNSYKPYKCKRMKKQVI